MIRVHWRSVLVDALNVRRARSLGDRLPAVTAGAERLKPSLVPELAQVLHDRLGDRLDMIDVLGLHLNATERAETAVRLFA